MTDTTSYTGFARFREVDVQLTTDLATLQNHCAALGLDATARSIADVLARSAKETFTVAVVGEFRRGKSTLINALLREKVLPSDVLPTTATLNRVTYGLTPGVEVTFKDGHVEQVPIDQLNDYVTKLTAEAEARAATVAEATIFYPSPYCKNNVDIVDTPGLNDDENMTQVTLSVLPKADAALFVIMAQSPFSEFERDFLTNRMLASDVGRVLFVVTSIDRYKDDAEADRVVQAIQERIETYVIEKAKKVMGEDSPAFAAFRAKLGTPKAYGLWAKQALKARETNDDALLAKSRFPAFEERLETFLTHERGAIGLAVKTAKVVAASEEVLRALQLRSDARRLDSAQFAERQAAAEQTMAELRDRRAAELEKVEISKKAAWQAVEPLVLGFWPELSQEAERIVDSYELAPDDLTADRLEATQQAILAEVSRSAGNLMQLLGERVDHQVETAVGQEVDRLATFEADFSQAMQGIHASFAASPSSVAGGTPGGGTGPSAGAQLAISTALNALVGGAGSAIEGYRAGGWKGLAIGGGAGLGTSIGIAVVLGMLGVAAGPITIVAAALGGAFVGRQALARFLPGASAATPSRIVDFRVALKKALGERFAEQQRDHQLATELRQRVDAAFAAVATNVVDETEAVMQDTAKTLTEVQRQIAENAALAAKETDEMAAIAASCHDCATRALAINRELLGVGATTTDSPKEPQA